MRSAKSHLGWLGSILGALILSTSVLVHAHDLSRPEDLPPARVFCSERLKSKFSPYLITSDIIGRFNSYSIQRMPRGAGFEIGPRARGGNLKFKEWILPRAGKMWKSEEWRAADGRRMQMIDVGFKNIEADSDRMNAAVLDYLIHPSEKGLRIVIQPEDAEARENLREMRSRIHDAVLENYRLSKGYLSERDFLLLGFANSWSDNTEVIALLDGPATDADSLSGADVEGRLALTIQITYFGKREFFRPSLRGMIRAAHGRDLDTADRLPFEFRLRPNAAGEFREALFRRFEREKTCELTRYTLFQPSLSREMHDRLLTEILARAVRRDMRYILASTDKYTMRYFARYGFKVFDRLPTYGETEEYLLYLDVHSPEFNETMARLQKSAANVTVVE